MVAEILPPSPTSRANANGQENDSTLLVAVPEAESSDDVGSGPPPDTLPVLPPQARSNVLTELMELPTTAEARRSPSNTNHRGIQIDTDDEEQPRVVVVEETIPNVVGVDAPSSTTPPILTNVEANATNATTTTISSLVPTPVESDTTATEHSYRGRSPNVARAPHNHASVPNHRGVALIPTSPISMLPHNAAAHPTAFGSHPSVVTRGTTTPNHHRHHHQSILMNSPTSPLPTPMSSYTSNPVNHRCINPASGRVHFRIIKFLLVTKPSH
jgi:hypothetical protein